MKRKILLPLAALLIGVVAAKSSALVTPVTFGHNPYLGICMPSMLAPNEPLLGITSCGKGSNLICRVRFINPENSSEFSETSAFSFYGCDVLLIKKD
jgi:hypothetical protein